MGENEETIVGKAAIIPRIIMMVMALNGSNIDRDDNLLIF